jgi:urocanate hydratase
MVLDGSERVDTILKAAIPWDVMIGVSRRSWARNENAMETAIEYNKKFSSTDHITLPYVADDAVVKEALKNAEAKK